MSTALLVIGIYLGVGALIGLLTLSVTDFMEKKVKEKTLPLDLHRDAERILEMTRAEREEKGALRADLSNVAFDMIAWPFLLIAALLPSKRDR